MTWISHGCTCVPHPEPPYHPSHILLPLLPVRVIPKTVYSTFRWLTVNKVSSCFTTILQPSPSGPGATCLQPHTVILNKWLSILVTHQDQLLFSHSVMSNSLWPYGLQPARLSCPSLSPRVCSNSCPWSWWCHPTISTGAGGVLKNLMPRLHCQLPKYRISEWDPSVGI